MAKQEPTGAERRRQPPVKVLSGQLRAAGNRSSGDPAEGVAIRAGKELSLRVSVVWMQGTVLEVRRDRDAALLMDETGTFNVHGVSGVPQGKPCLSPGKYIMVMGLIQAVSPEPLVHAVKVADLSELAALHRRMWKYEVEELQLLLA
ncbi:recQ-mediated genome instability protein 2 [Pholidichthys leucotaenia]